LDVLDLRLFSGAPEGQLYFFADIRQNRADIVDLSGKVVATDSERSLPSNVAVEWADNGWQMRAVEEAS
jgi:hypothetical protein